MRDEVTGRFTLRRWFAKLVRSDPEAATAELVRTLERVDGRLVIAANELGVTRRAIYRYVHALEAWAEVEAVRDRVAERGRTPRGLVRLRRALGTAA